MAGFGDYLSVHDHLPPLWPKAPRWPTDKGMKSKVTAMLLRSAPYPPGILEMLLGNYIVQRDADARWRLLNRALVEAEKEFGSEARPAAFWLGRIVRASGYEEDGRLVQRLAGRRLTCKAFGQEVGNFAGEMGLPRTLPGFEMPADAGGRGKCDTCGSPCEAECFCGEMYCSRECQRKDWPNHRKICETVFENNEIPLLMNQLEFTKVRSDVDVPRSLGAKPWPRPPQQPSHASGDATRCGAGGAAAQEAPTERIEGGFRRGEACLLQGLTSAAGAALNGVRGIVMGGDPSSGRVLVRLGDGDPAAAWKKLLPQNLQRLLGPVEPAGPQPCPSVSSGQAGGAEEAPMGSAAAAGSGGAAAVVGGAKKKRRPKKRGNGSRGQATGAFGFSEEDVEELLCQGIKPWDPEAAAALAVLHGEW